MPNTNTIARLYRRYSKVLIAYALRFLPQEEAEDAVHDMFSALLTRQADLMQADSAVTAYLFRAVRSRCLDRLKHRRVVAGYERQPHDELVDDMEQTLFDAEIYAELFRQIDRLPERQRQTLLNAFEGKTNMEIALAMNVGIETVKNQKHKAIVRLREMLKNSNAVTLFLLTIFSSIYAHLFIRELS